MPAKKSARSGKIDWSTAFIGWGFGIACMGIGVLVYWAVKTSPGVAGPSGNALRTSQRIVALLPNSLKEKLALVVAGVMFLGGIFLFCVSCYGVLKGFKNR
jgi:hypothetical protein